MCSRLAEHAFQSTKCPHFCVRIDDNNPLFGNTIALDTTQIHIKLTQTKPNQIKPNKYNLKLNNVFVGGTNHHNEYSVSIIESFEMKWSHFLRYIGFIDNNIVNGNLLDFPMVIISCENQIYFRKKNHI